MASQLLIVGIDPGTTVGYTVLDLKGKLIETGSEKELSSDRLITIINNLGLAVVVAADKHPIPRYVSLIATKLGSRLVCPGKEHTSHEKRVIAGHIGQNSHEMDAAYAAILAYKSLAQLIGKVERFVEEKNAQDISSRLMQLVLVSGTLSIRSAYELLISKKKEIRHELEIIQDRDYCKSYFRLLDLYRRLLWEKDLLNEPRIPDDSKKAPKAVRILIDPENRVRLKDKHIRTLKKELKKAKRLREKANKKYLEALRLLRTCNDYFPARLIRNMGIEYSALEFGKNEIVYVLDPTVESEKTLQKLEHAKAVISRRKPSSPRIPWLDSKDIDTVFIEDMALLHKADFEKAIYERDLLKRVITEYKMGK